MRWTAKSRLTGLAEELNAIAAEAQSTVATILKLATDTPGALLVTYDAVTDLEVERSAVARWGGRDALDAPLAGLTPTPLPLVFPTKDAMPWKVRRIALDLRGSFPPWRSIRACQHADCKSRAESECAVFRCAALAVARSHRAPRDCAAVAAPAGNAEVRLGS